MKKNKFFLLIQTIILSGTAVFILWLIVTQEIHWYIHQRFILLTVLALVLLTILAGLSIKRFVSTAETEQAPKLIELILLSVPLILGIVIPAKPLTAAAAETRNIIFSAPGGLTSTGNPITLSMETQPLTILDWLNIFTQDGDLSQYLGKPAQVSGFVIHDDHLPDNQFLLARFVITCCAADAFPVAIVVEYDGVLPQEDQWLIVEGSIHQTFENEMTLPLLKADSIDFIDQPGQPYLFP